LAGCTRTISFPGATTIPSQPEATFAGSQEVDATQAESALADDVTGSEQSAQDVPTPFPQPTLRQAAEKNGFLVGAAVDPGWLYGNQQYADLTPAQFNIVTPDNSMKFERIHPERDFYDFSEGDRVVDFALQNDQVVHGHPLVWDTQLPPWIWKAYKSNSFSRAEWMAILRGYIKTVVGHYQGRVQIWDVVNEAIADDGSLRNTIWLETIGPEYIALAFQWAHEADPNAILLYNDGGGEGMNRKSEGIYSLVQGLVQAGVPIDGVGLQMHVWLDGPPSASDLAENIRRLNDLGLQVHITEMDVRTQYSTASVEEKLAQQAEMYRYILKTCLQAADCRSLATWGVTDKQSWIPWYTGNPDMPLLFDQNNQPKPAYYAVLEELEANP
jgi:endo-1,4-beta-xylanase